MAEIIIREHESPKYQDRTKYNAFSGDVTLALAADLTTRGEILTKKLVDMSGPNKYLGFELVDDIHTLFIARQLFSRLRSLNAKTLNIAGNSIVTLNEHGCSQEFINQFVYEVIAQTHYFYPIEKIYTGGQTGVDMAGAFAAVKLDIPVEVTLPKGYIQRYSDHVDYSHTEDMIREQIDYFVPKIHNYTPLTKEQLANNSSKPSIEQTPAPQPEPEQNIPKRAGRTFEPLDDIVTPKKEDAKVAQTPSPQPEPEQYIPKRAGRTFDSIDDIMPTSKENNSTPKKFGFSKK